MISPVSLEVNTHCALGESPIWDEQAALVYWVDILDKKIFAYSPETKNLSIWQVPEYIGFIVQDEAGDFIGGFKSGLHKIKLQADGSIAAIRIDSTHDDGLDSIRYNDGTCDRDGNIWGGTMDMIGKEAIGNLFRYDAKLNRTKVASGFCITNGPAFSLCGTRLFVTETAQNSRVTKGVYSFNLCKDGILKNKKLLIKWTQEDSSPDGLTIDSEGNIWVGEWNGNSIRRFKPNGALLDKIDMPFINPTKIIFGGNELDTIFITSGRISVAEKILNDYPNTGGLFSLKYNQVKGMKTNRFKEKS